MAKEDDAKVTGVDDIRAAVENSLEADDPDKDDDDDQDTNADDSSNKDDSSDDDSDDSDSDDDDDSKDDDSDDSKDDDDDDSDDDDSDDDSDDDDEDKKKSGRKFDQFADKKDDTDEKYIANLEKGYGESSAESLRLKSENDTLSARNEAIMKAIAKDPKLAEAFKKALGEDPPKAGDSKSDDDVPAESTDPFLKDARTKWQKNNQAEAAAFIEANPELATDQKLRDEVTKLVRRFSAAHYEDHGELMSAGDAMRKAYAYLGREDKSKKDSKAELADRTKKSSTPPSKGSSKKKNRKSEASSLTKEQIELGARMGFSKEKLEKFANN